MNFFRDVTRRRRSSSASSAGDTSPTISRKPPTCDNRKQQFTNKDTGQPNQSSYMSIGGKQVAFSSIGATATLRRVFLPHLQPNPSLPLVNLTRNWKCSSSFVPCNKNSRNLTVPLYHVLPITHHAP